MGKPNPEPRAPDDLEAVNDPEAVDSPEAVDVLKAAADLEALGVKATHKFRGVKAKHKREGRTQVSWARKTKARPSETWNQKAEDDLEAVSDPEAVNDPEAADDSEVVWEMFGNFQDPL
nr:unnamed protein product [Ipomoea trifida]